MSNSMLEKLARSYVKNCGDAAATMRECAPAMADRTDNYLIKHFDRTYNDVPKFWEYVEEYRAEVKKEIALDAAAVMMKLTEQVTADYTEFTKVVVAPCYHCWIGHTNPPRIPNLSCSNCRGDGVKFVDITPTANLSPAARMLYRGAEQTKHGIKVHTANPDKALELLGRATGLFTSNLQIAATLVPKMPEMPVDQNEASRAYAEWIKQGGEK